MYMYMYMCKLHRYLNANHMYPYNVRSMYIVTVKVLRRPSCVSKRKRKAGFSPFGLASKLIPERDTPQLLNSFIPCKPCQWSLWPIETIQFHKICGFDNKTPNFVSDECSYDMASRIWPHRHLNWKNWQETKVYLSNTL